MQISVVQRPSIPDIWLEDCKTEDDIIIFDSLAGLPDLRYLRRGDAGIFESCDGPKSKMAACQLGL